MFDREHTLEVRREFDATPEALYAAWTQPELMRRWMGVRVDADVRVGGGYRREVETDGTGTFIHVGQYQLLEPPHRIVESFALEGVDDNPFTDEVVEILLTPLAPTRTELRLIDRWNGPALAFEEEQAADEAWGSWLDGIRRVL